MRSAKKWVSSALAVMLTAGLMAVPAQAAYILDLGTISGVWSASEEPVGTETVSLQYEKGLTSQPSPDGTPTYMPTGVGETTINLYPIGTEFSLVKQGIYNGKPWDTITVEYYTEGFRTNVTYGDITTKVVIEDTETIYKISNVGHAYGVIKDLYVRGVETKPALATAAPTASKVLVNGKETAFDAYTINGNNYFKIRDIASVLNGTGKRFDVIWDKNVNAVSMTSNHSYTAVGGEMAKGDGASKTATVNTAKVYMDGKEISLTAYTINGNNYVKLRDLGQLFNFGVRWENAVVIDTNTGYTAEFTDANAGQGVDLSDTDTNPYPKGE